MKFLFCKYVVNIDIFNFYYILIKIDRYFLFGFKSQKTSTIRSEML